MANKTIHQLTPASTITGDTQFAIYDTVSDSTKKATASQILGTEDILYADDPSTPSGEVDFTTQDTSLNPTSSVDVDLLTGSDSWSQRFVKISQMFKNIRYLLGKLGSTDISSIGDGSVTDAVSTLNNDVSTLNDNLTKSSSQLTISSGFTTTTNWCRKYGQIVQFYLEISSGTLSQSGWNTVATLPENYRSSSYFNFVGLNNSTLDVIQCNTDLAGNINIYKSSSLSSSINVRLYCTFII